MIAERARTRLVTAMRMPAAVAARLSRGEDLRAPAARVHSVFPRAVNIVLGDGRLLALHGPGPLRAPFAVAVAPWPLPGPLAAGMAVEVDRHRLTLGEVSIGWAPAARVALEIGAAGGPEAFPEAAGGSWRPLLDLPDLPMAPGLRRPAGTEAARRLGEAIAAADPDAFGEGARRLIGLGEGLTPAGDDCVVGALAALARAGHPVLAGARAAGAVERAARTRTTDLGREFLLHAVDGAFAEAVLDAVSGDAERAGRGIAALLALGGSSGADTLHGMRLAARAMGG